MKYQRHTAPPTASRALLIFAIVLLLVSGVMLIHRLFVHNSNDVSSSHTPLTSLLELDHLPLYDKPDLIGATFEKFAWQSTHVPSSRDVYYIHVLRDQPSLWRRSLVDEDHQGAHSLEWIFHFRLEEMVKANRPISIRNGHARVVHTADLNKADLVYVPAYLKLHAEQTGKAKSKVEYNEYMARLATTPRWQKCGGCDFVQTYASGNAIGLHGLSQANIALVVDQGRKPGWSRIGVPYPAETNLYNKTARSMVGLGIESDLRPMPAALFPFGYHPTVDTMDDAYKREDVDGGDEGTEEGGEGVGRPVEGEARHLTHRQPHYGKKKYLLFFRFIWKDGMARFECHNNTEGITVCPRQYVRGKLYQQYHDKSDDLMIGGGKVDHEQYYNEMRDSTFCACPRGVTPASSRFEQSLLNGCIPVVLSDLFIPPFSRFIDEREYMIRHPVTEIDTLEEQLRSIPERQIVKMQRALARLWIHFSYPSPPVIGDALHLAVEQMISIAELGQHRFDLEVGP
eukprot:TRINITY_DN13112_c0_g1_i1.p1 TRINITY_DN13112_c0_g1~~TRINITY_DN13112_c0_g1_i1.p1  ORF type:complete len:512 (+),score=57.56 TRINITY_DN13112_c0_g1_i1:225-1760(+)